MNLHLVPTPQSSAQTAHLAAEHLTADQLTDLLSTHPVGSSDAAALAAAQAHLVSCRPCAAELDSLRQSLELFQQASIALADREFGRLQQPIVTQAAPVRRDAAQAALWAVAAALLVAAFLPFNGALQRDLHPDVPSPAVTSASVVHTTESDEALLEDINRELSSSVPTPMLALVDPTGSSSAEVSQSSTATAAQNPASNLDSPQRNN